MRLRRKSLDRRERSRNKKELRSWKIRIRKRVII